MRRLEKNCTQWQKKQTDIQTDGHGEYMTELAQLGHFGENENCMMAGYINDTPFDQKSAVHREVRFHDGTHRQTDTVTVD